MQSRREFGSDAVEETYTTTEFQRDVEVTTEVSTPRGARAPGGQKKRTVQTPSSMPSSTAAASTGRRRPRKRRNRRIGDDLGKRLDFDATTECTETTQCMTNARVPARQRRWPRAVVAFALALAAKTNRKTYEDIKRCLRIRDKYHSLAHRTG